MSLIVKIGADTSAFNREMKNLTRDISGFSKGINDVGSSLTKKVTAPLMAIAGASIKVGMDFEQSMSKVKAISGATGEEMAELTKLANDMGKQTKFSSKDAADALIYMGMAGWKSKEMIAGLPGVLNLATAGGEDLAKTSDIVTDNLTALKMSAQDTNKFVDIMAKTITATNTNVSLMGDSMKYAAPVVGTLGGKMEDLSLAIGLMANSGIKGRMAGTALRGGLVNLVKPTEKMETQMKKYGIQIIKTKEGNMDLFKTMENLRKAVGGLDKDTQAFVLSSIFGKEALSGWSAVVNASDKDFYSLADAINNSTGAADEMSAIMRDNVAGSIEEATSALEVAGIAIFESLAPYVTMAANKVQELANAFSELPKEKRNIIIMGAAFAALAGPILMVTSRVINLYAKLKALPVVLEAIRNPTNINKMARAFKKWGYEVDEVNKKLVKNNALANAPKKTKITMTTPKATVSTATLKSVSKEGAKASATMKDVARNGIVATSSLKNVTQTAGGVAGKMGGVAKGATTASKAMGAIGGATKLASAGLFPIITALGIGTGLLFGLADASKKAKEDVSAFTGDASKGIQAMGEDTKKALTPLIESLQTVNKETGRFKMPDLGVSDKDIEKQAKEDLTRSQKIFDEKIKQRKKYLEANRGLTTKERENLLKATEDYYNNERKIQETHFSLRTEAQKKYNESYGLEQFKAGLEIVKQDQELLKQGELALAWTNTQKQEINDKYRKLEAERMNAFAAESNAIIADSFKEELAIVTSATDKRMAEEKKRHEDRVQWIHDNYIKGTEAFTEAMEAERREHERRTNDILDKQKQEKRGIEDTMKKYVEYVVELEKDGKITTDTADKIIRAMANIDKADPDINIKSNLPDVQSRLDSVMKKINDLDGQKAQITVYEKNVKQYGSEYKKGGGGSGYSATVNAQSQSKYQGGGRATGGSIYGKGWNLVGENGPELLYQTNNMSKVIPLNAQDKGRNVNDMVGGGGDVYNVTIVGANKSAEELFEEIERFKNSKRRSKGQRILK